MIIGKTVTICKHIVLFTVYVAIKNSCMPIENHPLPINLEKRSNQSKPIYQLQGIERESPYFCDRLPAEPTQKVVNPTQTRD